MKTIKVTSTERKILDAVKEAKRRGYKIVKQDWSIEWDENVQQFKCKDNQCCPLGAYLVVNQPPPSDQYSLECDSEDAETFAITAAKALGKNQEWADSFVIAYDSPNSTSFNDPAAAKTGKKINKLLFGG